MDPRDAPPGRNRGLLFGGLAGLSVLAAIAGAMVLWPDGDRERPASVESATESGSPAPTQDAFAPPDREAVRDAYAEVGRIYRAAGVSGLAEAGRRCFTGLAEQPTYRGLDYCTALDAFGAAFAQRVAGAPPPAESWFGQSEARYIRTAGQVMGPERDAAARLVDLRRMAIEVAREGGPAFAAPATGGTTAVASAPVETPPSAPTRPAGLPSSVTLETVPPAPAPAPVRRAEAPSPETRPARRAETSAPPLSPPVPGEAERRAYAEAREGPTAAEVAAARPRAGQGPSFNCRSARTSAERTICGSPELSALDRQLNAAYEDAIAAGTPRRVLRLEQDRWLAVRESAAPDPDALADTYRRRIRELEGG